MDIQLRVHVEPVEDEGWVWWADSDQLPGFAAAADHLGDMLERARQVLDAEGLLTSDARITTVLALGERSEPAVRNNAPADSPPAARGPEARQTEKTRTRIPA